MRKRGICHNYFGIKIVVEKKQLQIKYISVTNEIPEYSSDIDQPTNVLDGVCLICEYAMHYIDNVIDNNKTRDRIEKLIHGVCKHLPKIDVDDCNKFVNDNADAVITILSEEVSPKEACKILDLCKVTMTQIQGAVIKIITTYYNYR